MRTPILLAALVLPALLAGCPGDITVIERGDDDDVTEAPYEGDDAGECSDGADNDQDGLFDCEDDGCVGSPDCACDDGDGDGVCDEDDVCEGEDDTLDTDADGVPDCLDPCPDDNPDDTDGDGVCDSDDLCDGVDDTLDTDGDGVPDCLDPCPDDNPDDTDGDGICDSDDLCDGVDDTLDTDGDGVVDCLDLCPGADDTLDSDADGVIDCLDLCPGADDTLDSDADGVPDCLDPCPLDNPDDTDGDGICDSADVCPGADDTLDTDGDGVPDCLDPCPLDNPDDTDGDGVCDADDLCPGGDDTVDLDGDGVIDDCEQCLASNGWSQPDTDGDGLPDDCLLSVLLEDGGSYVTDNIEIELLSRGWAVNYATSAAVAATTDFSAYDVVALTFPGSTQSQGNVVAANDLGLVGLLIHRGGPSNFPGAGLGSDSFYQSDSCTVNDNTHFVTQTLPLGPLLLDYTYKTIVNGVAPSATTLVSCSAPSLVVHSTARRLTTPYYGHDAGMPWSAAADTLDVRSYAWAAGFGP